MKNESYRTDTNLQESGHSCDSPHSNWYGNVREDQNKRLNGIQRPQQINAQGQRKEKPGQVLIFSLTDMIDLSTSV